MSALGCCWASAWTETAGPCTEIKTCASVWNCPESPGDGILAGCKNIRRRHAVCNSWWEMIRLSGRLQDVRHDRSTPVMKKQTHYYVQESEKRITITTCSDFISAIIKNQPNESNLLQLHDPGSQHEIIMQNKFSTFFRRGRGITALHQVSKSPKE